VSCTLAQLSVSLGDLIVVQQCVRPILTHTFLPTLSPPARPLLPASQKAKVEVQPCSLRLSATPSCLGAMDFEQERLDSELKSYQQIFDRFTFSWGKWWHLNRYHFELSLVLKIVVLHLVTEAIRHHLSKPCTVKFWCMLVIMTGKKGLQACYTIQLPCLAHVIAASSAGSIAEILSRLESACCYLCLCFALVVPHGAQFCCTAS